MLPQPDVVDNGSLESENSSAPIGNESANRNSDGEENDSTPANQLGPNAFAQVDDDSTSETLVLVLAILGGAIVCIVFFLVIVAYVKKKGSSEDASTTATQSAMMGTAELHQFQSARVEDSARMGDSARMESAHYGQLSLGPSESSSYQSLPSNGGTDSVIGQPYQSPQQHMGYDVAPNGVYQTVDVGNRENDYVSGNFGQ